jgi:hypothetical protein
MGPGARPGRREVGVAGWVGAAKGIKCPPHSIPIQLISAGVAKLQLTTSVDAPTT